MERIILNQVVEIDRDNRYAEGAYRERRPVGKI